MKRRGITATFVAGLVVVMSSLSGCGRPPEKVAGRTHVKIGWIGLVCEAPLFAAYENGYFKDEGLDAEMVKSDWTRSRPA